MTVYETPMGSDKITSLLSGLGNVVEVIKHC